MWFTVGWICKCRTTYTEEPWVWRADYKLHECFQLHGGSVPQPCLVQELTGTESFNWLEMLYRHCWVKIFVLAEVRIIILSEFHESYNQPAWSLYALDRNISFEFMNEQESRMQEIKEVKPSICWSILDLLAYFQPKDRSLWYYIVLPCSMCGKGNNTTYFHQNGRNHRCHESFALHWLCKGNEVTVILASTWNL